MSMIFNILNTFLNYLFNLTGDWGIAIIILAIAVRLLLLPLSIKQRISMGQQQVLSEKITALKKKYKNNKKKLKIEMQKYYRQSTNGMLGCFVSLLQLPIISSLYFVIINMPANVGTVIIPWISSLKVPDKYFIIPAIYMLVSLSPNLLPYIKYFKTVGLAKMTKSNFIFIGIFSIFITIKAPVAIGLYFITTSLFSLFEEIGYRLCRRNISLN